MSDKLIPTMEALYCLIISGQRISVFTFFLGSNLSCLSDPVIPAWFEHIKRNCYHTSLSNENLYSNPFGNHNFLYWVSSVLFLFLNYILHSCLFSITEMVENQFSKKGIVKYRQILVLAGIICSCNDWSYFCTIFKQLLHRA